MTLGRLLSEASAPELPLVVVVCGEEARPAVGTRSRVGLSSWDTLGNKWTFRPYN